MDTNRHFVYVAVTLMSHSYVTQYCTRSSVIRVYSYHYLIDLYTMNCIL